jgi:DNA-binding NtrC family response regulator
MNNRIIVIDDEQDFLESVKRGLITSGFKNVRTETDPLKAAADFKNEDDYDIGLIDITMPGMDGIELLEIIKTHSPKTECIMVTAVDEARMAVQCLRKGAYDYLVKPISKEDLVVSLRRALERKRLVDILDLGKSGSIPKIVNTEAFSQINTRSAKVLRILKEAELHAGSDVPVLITGETGTGKELLSQAIHAASSRAKYLFTPINMDALTAQLFDAEFFGHTKGAFTGAEKDRAGYLETTHKGTLFLDEIGNLPLELQGKLLRVLQDGEYIKIGTSTPRRTDVRFIAATNKNLEKLMAQKKFRKDLYYRLKGGWLHLPPLRERKDDIPALIERFVEEYCGSSGTDLEPGVMSLLEDYHYPGNIRELKAIIQAALNLAQGKPISANHLPTQLRTQKPKLNDMHQSVSEPIVTLAQVEKKHIIKVYELTGKNKSQTAKLIGVGINTLRRKLDAYGFH